MEQGVNKELRGAHCGIGGFEEWVCERKKESEVDIEMTCDYSGTRSLVDELEETVATISGEVWLCECQLEYGVDIDLSFELCGSCGSKDGLREHEDCGMFLCGDCLPWHDCYLDVAIATAEISHCTLQDCAA